MKYNWHLESVNINSITILNSEKSAQEFMDKIYPFWTDTIIVSADRVFPKDEKLKELALAKLSEDQNLPVIVFGQLSLEKIPVISNKKLIMDEFLSNDMYRYHDSERVFNWDEKSIAMFCFFWVNQSSESRRLNYADMREVYNPDSFRWYNHLIYE